MGYTANSLSGGTNGALNKVSTGDLDICSNTIQTQQGGNITILAPGGQALVGAASAPPAFVNAAKAVISGPSNMGILTLEQGDVNIFTDQSLLLAQSRVFTEQGGGSMTIWSSNGDINAGKGAKTVADVPQPSYFCSADFYCTRDARGEVTGAGIATLQTTPGAKPGDVHLIAPRGTVDAGAAGIRVSGNLYVAALKVANADNIQVKGTAIGIPRQAAPNIGALTAASNTAGAAAAAAAAATKQGSRNNNSELPSIFTVEVIGYGGGDGRPDQGSRPEPRRRNGGPQTYNYDQSSPFQVLGAGDLSETETKALIQEKAKFIAR